MRQPPGDEVAAEQAKIADEFAAWQLASDYIRYMHTISFRLFMLGAMLWTGAVVLRDVYDHWTPFVGLASVSGILLVTAALIATKTRRRERLLWDNFPSPEKMVARIKDAHKRQREQGTP